MNILKALSRLGILLICFVIFLAVSALLDTYVGDIGAANGVISVVVAAMPYGFIDALIERKRHRQYIERFIAARKQPQRPLNLLSKQQAVFSPAWFAVTYVPEAGIALPADNSALQITSTDLDYDVLIPIELITQIEFDPGDGPPGRRYPGMSWRREWFGLPFPPTVYLGLRLAPSADVTVYPLCFHPDRDEDARILHQRLLDGQQAANQSVSFPLETTITEEMFPGSFESQYLRTGILQRFWPDYRATTVREWLNR